MLKIKPRKLKTTAAGGVGISSKLRKVVKTNFKAKDKKIIIKKNKIQKSTKIIINEIGAVILAKVIEIGETEIVVALPFNQKGYLSPVSISESYKKLMKEAIENGNTNLKPLNKLFKIDQLIYVKLLSKKGNNFIVSMLPKDIHKSIKYNRIEKYFTFIGAIEEIQDDDYIIESGIKNLKVTLKKSKAKYDYEIGDLIICSVTKIKPFSFFTSANVKELESIDNIQKGFPVLPGGHVEFIIKEKLLSGDFSGTILNGKCNAFVQKSKDFDQLKIDDSINGKIVSIISENRVVVSDKIDNQLKHENNIKNEKNIGDIIVAVVETVIDKNIHAKIDGTRLKCFISNVDYLPKAQLKSGFKLIGKIFGIYNEKYQVTTRIEYFLPNCKILNNLDDYLDDLKVGKVLTGTCVKEFDKFYIIKFFNNLNGTISKRGNENNLYIGKIDNFQVTGLKGDENGKIKIYLGLPTVKLSDNDDKLGDIVNAIVIEHNRVGLKIQIDNDNSGFILNQFLLNKADQLKDGTEIECINLGNDLYSIRDVNYYHNNQLKTFDDYEIDDIVRGFIINFTNDNLIEIYVPIKNYDNKRFTLSLNDLIENTDKKFNIFYGQIIHLKIIEKTSNSFKFCPKLSSIWNNFDETANYFCEYLKRYKNENDLYKIGTKVNGIVLENKQNPLNLSIKLQINETVGWLKSNEQISIGSEMSANIIWINYNNTLQLTTNTIKDCRKQFNNNEIIEAEVILIIDNFAIAIATKKKFLLFIPKHLYYNDFIGDLNSEINYGLNNFVVLCNYEKYVIAIPENYYNSKLQKNNKKRKILNSENFITQSTSSLPSSSSESKIKKLKKNNKIDNNDNDDEIDDYIPTISNFWTSSLKTINQTTINDNNQNDDDDGDNLIENNLNKLKKKLTSAEKREIIKKEEARIREIEENLAKSNLEPQSADHFERLVLSTPNDSMLWIKYMAFYLQSTEIEKARNIGQTALKKISFREESEKLNIWNALLNLEIRYGNNESFTNCFDEALRVNDQYKIYTKCLDIYVAANMIDEANNLMIKIKKKFRSNSEMWIKLASTYFEINENEKAKKLLSRSLASLNEKDHIKVITQFAILMCRYNEHESAHALLEQIITSYPKRVDIWFVYIDILIKSNEIILARQTLDRAVSQNLPAKKMRSLFKKYLEFEKKNGNAQDVDKVKIMAEEFVTSKISSNDKTNGENSD